MNRRYKVEDYLEQIEKINKLFELPFLGSDVIAGFVGETQEDFETTLKNLEKSGLTAIHTFPYSIRKGTQAEKMEGHLPDKVKEERATAIKKISAQKTKEFLEKNVGTVHSVLVEKHLDKHLNVLKGMSENYITVLLNSDDRNLINTIQKVKITEIKDGKAFGEIILI